MKNILEESEVNRIKQECIMYRIRNYIINGDGSIDVDGDVMMVDFGLTELPVTFNKVSGNFVCRMNGLTTLRGCPNSIGGYFDCSYNRLSSLDIFPENVSNEIYISDNLLPRTFNSFFLIMRGEDKRIFIKYQSYYEVWLPEFSEENMKLLIEDIKEGLR